jgi:hypothetical protein
LSATPSLPEAGVAGPGRTETAAIERAESPARVVGCLLLLLVALHLAISPALQVTKWHVEGGMNPAFLEAQAWQAGRMTLEGRPADTALYHGNVYSVHPPWFALLSYGALWLAKWYPHLPQGEFYPAWYVLVVAVPLPFVGFWAFQQVLKKAAWAAVLTFYWLVGTPLLPQLILAGDGSINAVNHVLTAPGLMLIAGDLLGRRRMWPAAIGLVIATWSRPHLVFFGLAALWIAWSVKDTRRWNLVIIGSSLVIAVGTLMTLNWIKFDSPFETGYRYIYDYRPNSQLARRALAYGVVSPHFLGENAYCMNLSPPRFRLTSQGVVPENGAHGVAIWMTSPLALGVFVGVRKWWADKAARAVMLASLPVIATVLMYHWHGASPTGYYAYGSDFVPIWLVVIAAWTASGWRRSFTLACLAWSALYFHIIWRAYA